MNNNTLNIVKVGGAIVENDDSLNQFLNRFAALQGRKLLVHGGGRSATAMASRLGIDTVMIEGRRVTSPEMLRVVTMVYAGLVNKNIVAALQARGLDAVGLTGADLDSIAGHRRSPSPIDYGCVGDVDSVNDTALAGLIATGAIPVMAPLIHDRRGNLLNTNADTIASSLAIGLARRLDVTLTFCFEKPGVLADPDNDLSVIPQITAPSFESLKADGTVSGGMLPKLNNAFSALRQGVGRVVITSATALGNPDAGTVISL